MYSIVARDFGDFSQILWTSAIDFFTVYATIMFTRKCTSMHVKIARQVANLLSIFRAISAGIELFIH
jgi:hypothetical protein